MKGITHLLFAALICALLTSLSGIDLFPAVLFALFGSLLPDLDHPRAYVHKLLFVSRPVAFAFKHRGVFHSLWVPLCLLVLLPAFVPLLWVVWLVVGFLSHLALDGLTPMGIGLFHPLRSARLRGPFKTGGLSELILQVCFCFFLVALLW